MKLMDRYIARTVINGSLGVMGVLSGLALFFRLIDELEKVDGDYTLLKAVGYVLLSLPSYLYQVFPAAVLIGALIGLGGLAARSELTVFRATGASVLRLFQGVLVAGVILMTLAVILGEFLGPAGYEKAKVMRAEAQGKQLSTSGYQGVWLRDENRFIRVDRMMADQQLVGIDIWVFGDDRQLKERIEARKARYRDGQWYLNDVTHREVGGEFAVYTRAEETWDRLVRPELFELVVVDPGDMPAWRLYDYVDYLEANGLESERYRLAFWIKIFMPASVFVMLVLAMPFAFGSQRSAGAGQRIFIGILVGLAFMVVGRVLNHLGPAYHIPPLISAVLPPLLFLGIGLWGIRRVA